MWFGQAMLSQGKRKKKTKVKTETFSSNFRVNRGKKKAFEFVHKISI